MLNRVIAYLVLMVLTVVATLFFQSFRKFKAGLNAFEYYAGGGMSGGHEMIAIKAGDEGKAHMKFEKAEWHNSEPEVREYIVDSEILAEIQEVFYRYRMISWEKLRRSSMEVLDADTHSFSFSFGPDHTHFSTNQNLPMRSGTAIGEIFDIITEYKENAEKSTPLVSEN